MQEAPRGAGSDEPSRARDGMGGRARLALITAVAVMVAVVGASTALAGAGPRRTGKEGALFAVRTHDKVVALTFDDGPDPRWTPAVLAMLRAHHAHATFFLVGEHALAHRDLVADLLADGHEIGNHTFDHPHLPALGDAAIREEIARGEQAIVDAGAPAPTLFRPPIGLTDERVAAATRDAGLRTVLWRGCVEHFVNHQPVAVGVSRMLDGVRPGAILLAHDGGIPDRSRTMDALPALLDALTARGYRIVTVSELEAEATIDHK